MNKNEINPFTGKELNPEIVVVDKRGKTHMVAYVEDFFKTTGVYDRRVGCGVRRLNQKLTPEEWRAVSKYFKKYNQKGFTWGTAKHDMVISCLVKMRNPNVDCVTVRRKMTADGVRKLKECGANMRDTLTGEWLFPQ